MVCKSIFRASPPFMAAIPESRPAGLPGPAKNRSVVLFRGEEPVPPILKPKTALYDLFVSKSKNPERNGVTKMDLERLSDDSDWFRRGENYRDKMARKKVMLQNYRDVVSATLPEGKAGAAELLEIMAQYLPQHFPDSFKREGRKLHNLATGDVHDLDNLSDDPINIAAQLVEEDLILLHQGEDGRYRVSAGSLNFASDWSIGPRLGKTMLEVHEPVASLNEHLGAAIDKFLEKLAPGKRFWRANYLTNTSMELVHIPEIPEFSGNYKDGIPTTPENVERLILRTERDTLSKLPTSGDILFAIHVNRTPYKDLPPVIAGLLGKIYASLPEEFIAQYRKWTETEKQVILDYLAQKAGGEERR